MQSSTVPNQTSLAVAVAPIELSVSTNGPWFIVDFSPPMSHRPDASAAVWKVWEVLPWNSTVRVTLSPGPDLRATARPLGYAAARTFL